MRGLELGEPAGEQMSLGAVYAAQNAPPRVPPRHRLETGARDDPRARF